MALMIYVTFALNFWVPFDLVWYYIKKKHPVDKHWIWERVYRALFVVLITLIAITFPNVGNFIGLVIILSKIYLLSFIHHGLLPTLIIIIYTTI